MRSERARARIVAGLGSIITLFSLMVAVDALQTVPGTSIAAHWPLDTSTTTTSDVAGVDNVATLVGSPPTVTAMFGNGLQFASASSRRLTVPDHAELGIAATDSFTVGVWIRPSGTGIMRVMNKWNGTYGFHLDINTGAGGGASAGRVRLRVKDNGNHDHDYVVDGAIGNNAWKHIAGVYDRTTKKAQIYVNGLPIGAARDITTLTGTLVNTTILEIGALANAGFFNGIMDEPILYRRALSAAEIQQLAAIPQGLTATTGAGAQIGKVVLNWTAVPGAASYNILRGPAATGPFTQVVNVTGATTTYTDPVAAGTYYYVIQAVFTGGGSPYTTPNSAAATGTSLPPQVTALPATGLQTNENGATTGFTIKFNAAAPAGGSLVTVSSSAITEGLVSTTYVGTTATATGFQFTVPAGTTPTIPVTITGVDDVYADGAVAYTITVTASGFTGLTIPLVQCTNNDNDTPGVTINRTSGLVTTEAGGTDKFSVVLNTRPYGDVTMSLTSTLTSEGTVSPSSLTFTTLNWNTPHEATLTGQDDTTLDFTIPYTIVTGALVTTDTRDVPAYGGLNPPDVQAGNVDDEVIPPAPDAWGGGGSCGLLGLEAVLATALALLARRRRRLS